MKNLLIGLLTLVPMFALANAAAGVSDQRVNLPEAPGAISGVGENASVAGNQGALQYAVSIETPAGFSGVTPQVSLSYSSNAGNDIVGIGWNLPTYSIERMTSKGLQKYDLDDRFVVDGSEELVRTAVTATTASYRARFEGGFIRYTWRAKGTGEAGDWIAEYPDGRVGYFGADKTGAAVPTAKVTVPMSSKTFRWHLVSMVDRFGHAMNLSWTKDTGGTSLLERMDYLYEGATAKHSVRFTYEPRVDTLSDGKPGFELQLTQRLKEVRIFSGAEQMRSYSLTYQDDTQAGGASRVSKVSRAGRSGGAHPVSFSFDYSRTLGAACDSSCEKPFVKNAGALGVDFSQGRTTLIDINGDALPDVLASDANGVHRFFYAKLDAEGRTSFATTAVNSTKTIGSSSFVLGQAAVQVIDVNGDGFVDIVQPKIPAVLCNNGSGDWVDASFCSSSAPGVPANYSPEEDTDALQADPKYVRFFDYDNDKRIDWLRTFPGGTAAEVLANTPTGFQPVTINTIGAVFDESTSNSALQLADINGDGLQDPVQLVITGNTVQLQYRLNFGFGVWSDWRNTTLVGLDANQAGVAEIQDVNGDNLADVVSVSGNEVRLILGRNGNRFESARVITSTDLGSGAIPVRGVNTVVAYADMNGNGSDDIVWIEPGGAISYLELFPVRPNLLSRISNGIGAIQRFAYGTSIGEQARDVAAGKPWTNKVPNPMTLVTSNEQFVTLTATDMNGNTAPTGLSERTLYRYHSGYYDGIEKQFRGFEQVDLQLDADATRDAHEPSLTTDTYDVGKTSPLFAGLQINQKVFAGAARELLREERSLHEACAVDGLSTIMFACERAHTTIEVERVLANAVTTRIETDYDGFGNVKLTRQLGVIHRGTPENPTECTACTASGEFGNACGPMCMGDERYEAVDFIVPSTANANVWQTSLVSRIANGAVASPWATETFYYFDGPDFEGLAAGQATMGVVTRVAKKNAAGVLEVKQRLRIDAHGNALESIDALGSVADSSNHRTVYTFDTSGFHMTSIEQRVSSTGMTGIRREFLHESTFEEMAQASNWFPVNGSTPLSAPQLTRYRYDEHGRITKMLEAGDTETAPSQEIQYFMADPVSRVLISERSSNANMPDIVTARCFDGRGRLFQQRYKLSDNSWQVGGFTEFDSRGVVVKQFYPSLSSSANCDMAAPTDVPSMKFKFDALQRALSETESDGTIRHTEYLPLTRRAYDENDNDAAHLFKNTPTVSTYDGLGRITSSSRLFEAVGSGTPAVTKYSYDVFGEMTLVRDAAGHVKTQIFDSQRRLVRIDDPNAGTSKMEFDLNDNVVKMTDARNVEVQVEYDGANRRVSRFNKADPTNTRMNWTYDRLMGCTECTNAGGKMVSVTWPGTQAGSDQFGFDAKGNQVFQSRTIAGQAFVTRRKFDSANRVIGVTHPGGAIVDLIRDGAGRIKSISGALSSIQYDTRGDLEKLVMSNGAATAFSRDMRRRLSGIKTTSKTNAELLNLNINYDKASNIIEVKDAALADRVRHAEQFTLDALNRVTRDTLTHSARTEQLDYGFDSIDNITKVSSDLGVASKAHVGDFSYVTGKPNAVATAGSLNFEYDSSGGLKKRGATTYQRDYMGRISAATGGDVEGTFTWADERIAKEEGHQKTLYINSDFEVRDGISHIYAKVGDLRVARFENDALASTLLSDLAPATGTTALTVMGDKHIDIGDAWLAQAAGVNVVQLTGGPTPSKVEDLLQSAARRLLMTPTTWLQQNHLHSVVLATNAQGEIQSDVSYYPTGKVRQQNGFVDHYGFTGQEADESTGLLHFQYRELDVVTGRWDSVDPAFRALNAGNIASLGESTVGYAYVANGFSSAYDPTGLGGEGSRRNTVERKAHATKLKKNQRARNVGAAVSLALAIASAAASYASDAPGDSLDDASKGLSSASLGVSALLQFASARKETKQTNQKVDRVLSDRGSVSAPPVGGNQSPSVSRQSSQSVVRQASVSSIPPPPPLPASPPPQTPSPRSSVSSNSSVPPPPSTPPP